jgi:hypothetical protein
LIDIGTDYAMNALTNIQFINNEQGQPQFVVMPYNQYLELSNAKPIDVETGVPSEVVNMVLIITILLHKHGVNI